MGKKAILTHAPAGPTVREHTERVLHMRVLLRHSRDSCSQAAKAAGSEARQRFLLEVSL